MGGLAAYILFCQMMSPLNTMLRKYEKSNNGMVCRGGLEGLRTGSVSWHLVCSNARQRMCKRPEKESPSPQFSIARGSP